MQLCYNLHLVRRIFRPKCTCAIMMSATAATSTSAGVLRLLLLQLLLHYYYLCWPLPPPPLSTTTTTTARLLPLLLLLLYHFTIITYKFPPPPPSPDRSYPESSCIWCVDGSNVGSNSRSDRLLRENAATRALQLFHTSNTPRYGISGQYY